MKVKELNCQQVASIIAESGNSVNLVISRNVLAGLLPMASAKNDQVIFNSDSTSNDEQFLWKPAVNTTKTDCNNFENKLDCRGGRRKVNFYLNTSM